jgi:uncharacterized phage-associated protein
MKLQKLVYYCQALHLAFYDKPLFSESIEAWTHGPVCPDLYHELKCRGSAPITVMGPRRESLNDQEKELIRLVYARYGQYSASKLREMTHNEAPWKDTVASATIPEHLIESYFKTAFLEVALEDIPPLTEAQKRDICRVLEEAEINGEIDVAQFC